MQSTHDMRRPLRPALLLAACCSCLLLNTAAGQFRFPSREFSGGGSIGDDGGRRWAVLIGVGGYQKAAQLLDTANDVDRLAETLTNRAGFDADRIFRLADTNPSPDMKPTKENLEQQLQAWLRRPRRSDTLLVYFSGHGFRDDEGRMYLAPVDCDPRRAEQSGVPITWFRDQIKRCPARTKVLILDSCHAGSEKSAFKGLAAVELGAPFKETAGVITLASSTAEQQSLMWREKEQSLFTYWLNQGLKGHADHNHDGAVDIDELYKYVDLRVRQTVATEFPDRAQTPVRIVGSDAPGVPVVSRLAPLGLRQLIDQTAEHFAATMRHQRLQKVGVLEFTNFGPLGDEVLDAEFGLLGRWCAEELEQQLGDRGDKHFSTVARTDLTRALRSQKFKVGDLANPEKLRNLSKELGQTPVMAVGRIHNRFGRRVEVECKLLSLDDGEVVETGGGRVRLSDEDLQMLGFSVQAPEPEDTPARPPAEEDLSPLFDVLPITHPLADESFPFRLRVMVGGKQRPSKFVANDCFIGLKTGEEFEIWVENKSGKPVKMRLFVNGRNTLPPRKNAAFVSTKGIAREHDHLDSSRAWILEKPHPYAIRGFVTKTGIEGGSLRKFTVAAMPAARKQRREFAEQAGIITAAFYEALGGKTGEIEIVPGRTQAERLPVSRDYECGKFLAVVHLRCVDASAPAASGGPN